MGKDGLVLLLQCCVVVSLGLTLTWFWIPVPVLRELEQWLAPVNPAWNAALTSFLSGPASTEDVWYGGLFRHRRLDPYVEAEGRTLVVTHVCLRVIWDVCQLDPFENVWQYLSCLLSRIECGAFPTVLGSRDSCAVSLTLLCSWVQRTLACRCRSHCVQCRENKTNRPWIRSLSLPSSCS